MPNYVEHKITIQSEDEAVLNRLLIIFTDEINVADHLIPYPLEFREKDEKAKKFQKEHPNDKVPFKDGFNSGGYEWCLEHWDTKSGLLDVQMKKVAPNRLDGTFDTAWRPALSVYQILAEQNPNTEIKIWYFEMGENFSGFLHYKAGEMILNDYHDYITKEITSLFCIDFDDDEEADGYESDNDELEENKGEEDENEDCED